MMNKTQNMKGMKQWRMTLGMILTAMLGLAACDEHRDFPDTSIKVGHILCTDGKVMSYEDFSQSGKEAIAVVFHLNRDEAVAGNGYAVYLHDLAPEAFADSIGIAQGTSADLTALDGNENTFALYETTETASPMAEQVFDLWRYGQSAYVPSVAQMRLLYASREAVNPYIEQCGGMPTARTVPTNVGTGLRPKWPDRRLPKHGSIQPVAVRCRRPRNGKHIRYVR